MTAWIVRHLEEGLKQVDNQLLEIVHKATVFVYITGRMKQ